MIKYSGTDYRRIVAYDNDNLNRLRAERIRSSTGASWPSPWPPTTVPLTPASGDLLYDVTPGYGDTSGFDAVGNRRSRTSSGVNLVVQGGTGSALLNPQTSAAMLYDTDDRLNYVASPASYDKNGNALYQNGYTSQTTPSLVAPGSGTTDQYDLENRLTQRGTTVTIVYDGDGNRVKKTVGTTDTHYLVDYLNPTGYGQVLEEQPNPGGTPTVPMVKYTYGLDLVNQDRGGTVSYYGYDGQGTVRYLTSTTPAVTDTYTYDAYGLLLLKLGTTVNNYLYGGEQWDPELGMYYLRARYYHPDIGRFWTMDSYEGSQSDPLSLHKYLYAHNNPINGIDPSGHDLVEQIAVMAIRTTLFAMNAYGAVSNAKQTARYSVSAIEAISDDDPWNATIAIAGAVMHGGLTAMNVLGVKAYLSSLPPPPAAGVAVLGNGTAGIWQFALSNPATKKWVFEEFIPVVGTGIGLFASSMGHEAQWEHRDSGGKSRPEAIQNQDQMFPLAGDWIGTSSFKLTRNTKFWPSYQGALNPATSSQSVARWRRAILVEGDVRL